MKFVRNHTLLCLVVLGYLGLGLVYSNVIPLFEGPDEPAYFEHVLFILENRTLPSEARPGLPGYVQTAGHPPLYPLIGALLTAPMDTSGYEQWDKNPYFSYGRDTLGQNVFLHSAQETFPYRGVPLAVHVLRLWSLLLGAGTVVATYFLAGLVAPRETWLAIGAAAFVAFLPQFVFMSSLVNSDNMVNFLCAVSMIQIVRVGLGRDVSARGFVVLGGLLGLANIAKGSALALIPVTALAVLLASRMSERRQLLKNIAFGGIAFLVVSGWWYVRNLILYGDPLALNWRRIAYPEAVRASPVTFEQVAEFGRQVGGSFWARFGWANIFLDDRVYLVFALAAVLALVGLAFRLVRDFRRPDFPRVPFMLLGADVLIVVVLLFSLWYGYPVGGDQGRYLFTALPALAIFFVYGLMFYFPTKSRWVPSLAVGVGLFAVSALVPFLVLVPAHKPYAPPQPIALSQIPSHAATADITFNDAVRIIAFSAPATVTRSADAHVRVYWQALKNVETDNNVRLRLVASDGTVLWERARRPGRGLSPSDQWTSGMIIPDLFTVRIPPNAPTGQATISVGMAERNGKEWTTSQGETAVVLTTLLIQ